MADLRPDFGPPGLRDKLASLPWGLVALLFAVAAFGGLVLYSAADGHMRPWAEAQMLRFAAAFALMIGAALVDIRHWLRAAYFVYALALLLVAAVDLRGFAGMGARRWISLGLLQLQPSELMNVALALALARYFHRLPAAALGRVSAALPPLLMILVPAALVLKEPDLGTALMMLMAGAALLFVAGLRLRLLLGMLAAGLAALPLAWHFLRGYQKTRIYGFLDPHRDPLGAGYHVLQSKIALGSGGLFGKGFLLGTQSHLDFLPEKQTDFIFATLAEEAGFVGAIGLLVLYAAILACGLLLVLGCRNHFGRMLGIGVLTGFFLYVFINVAMVAGLIPVVGVPLPLVSYGGTAMLSVMFGMGLVLNVAIHREMRLGRHGEVERG